MTGKICPYIDTLQYYSEHYLFCIFLRTVLDRFSNKEADILLYRMVNFVRCRQINLKCSLQKNLGGLRINIGFCCRRQVRFRLLWTWNILSRNLSVMWKIISVQIQMQSGICQYKSLEQDYQRIRKRIERLLEIHSLNQEYERENEKYLQRKYIVVEPNQDKYASKEKMYYRQSQKKSRN